MGWMPTLRIMGWGPPPPVVQPQPKEPSRIVLATMIDPRLIERLARQAGR